MIYLLHISDLHLVTDPQWNNMKNAILYSVREKLRHVARGQKLLIITGDFHNFIENHYQQAEQFLPQLFKAMDIEADKDVFVIPGNHDLSVPDFLKKDRKMTIKAVSSDPTMLQDGLDKLLSCYDNYIKFVQAANIYPADCEKRPVQVHVRTWRNKLNLLHLNTTLVADGSVKNNQMVDTLIATSDEIRKKLQFENLPCIAVGHNSYYDLLPQHQQQLSALFLQEYVSAYLCGDRHQRNSKREENRINLGKKLSAGTIPNIVSYRSSTEEGDTYSDFGMIWHLWEEKTGHVRLEFMKWDPQDQAQLQPDGEDLYDFRETNPAALSSSAADQDNGCWFSNHTILEKSRITVKDPFVRRFLQGGRCEWNLAFSDRIVLRDKVAELYEYAVDGGVCVLTGPGGEGKTTILKQMCAKLISNQITVFYYRGYGALKLPDKLPDQAVFVIDNPPNHRGFKHFLEEAAENGLTLILGARQNEWNLLKANLSISDRDVSEIELPTLTEKESWSFTECILSNLRCSRSKKEIKELFHNNSYGFLYAAMLMIVSGKNSLEEIASEIIDNLSEQSPNALLLLAHIVLSESCKTGFIFRQFKSTCNILNISPNEATNALSREISLNGEIYQTRHEIISKLFYKRLFSDSGLLRPAQTDQVLENLILFYLKRYQDSYGGIKNSAWHSVLQLSGALPQTSLETQKYLFDRILDETKSGTPRSFYRFPSYINDNEVLLLFYRKCFDRDHISDALLLKWCDLLLKNGSPWNIEEPYSPAWIMKNVCLQDKAGSPIWLAWAQLEAREKHVGDYDCEYSARWIFREACFNHNADSDTWLAWAMLEAQEEHTGNYDCEYSARWIFREACFNHNADSSAWLAWAMLETQEKHTGDYDCEYSARWIFREACLNHNADSNTWLAWAMLEAQEKHTGDYDCEYSARWIFREACFNHNADSSAWLAWAMLEAQEKHTGDYNCEYSARWIFREACLNHNADDSAWRAWAMLEAQEKHVGDYDCEYSARWIFREACLNHSTDGSAWLAWAQLEIVEQQIGSYNDKYTARWIFRKACLEYNADAKTWLAWAQLELQKNQIGNCKSENTARWIFSEGIRRFPDATFLYPPFVSVELSQHSVEKARSILRQSLQYNKFCTGHLAILEFFCGNIDSDDSYCTCRLMKQMEKDISHSFGALQYLYYCCLLLEQTENAKNYHRQILLRPEYDPENISAETFIRLCREAFS